MKMLAAPANTNAIPRPTTSGLEVWAVEGVGRSILLFLDLRSLDGVLHTIQATPALHGYLQDRALWDELSRLHFGGERDTELRFLALPVSDRGWDWTSRDRTCLELQDFLRSVDERAHFEKTVVVMEGDIGKIRDISGVPLDGIAFPTNSHLTNHYVGAAQAVFSLAGPGLTNFVNDPSFRGRRATGLAVVTPGFSAGVTLIHCVGPRISMPNCYDLLATTYENAMSAILRENLACVTMASISTGNMGVPCKQGAQVGLRAIQKFLRANHWEGKLAIVCYEEQVFQSFTDGMHGVLENFNVVPATPDNDTMPHWPF